MWMMPSKSMKTTNSPLRTYPSLRAVAEGVVVVALPETVSLWTGWVVIGISWGEGERPVATSLAITTPERSKTHRAGRYNAPGVQDDSPHVV